MQSAEITAEQRRAEHAALDEAGAVMSRQRLPNRRGSITFDVEALGLTFTVTASRFNHGELGEVFIQNHKTNSAAGILASDCAIAASLALQFGCPAEVLARALSRDAQGRPTGPLGAALDTIAGRP
jgi:ribonucleoside-diphosphate reductase alpha chain